MWNYSFEITSNLPVYVITHVVWNFTSVWYCSCWAKYSKQVTFKIWVGSVKDAFRGDLTDSFWKTFDQLLSKSDIKMFIFDMCLGNICEWMLNFFQQHLSREFWYHYSEVIVKILSVFHVTSPVTVAYIFSKVPRCQPGTYLIDAYLENLPLNTPPLNNYSSQTQFWETKIRLAKCCFVYRTNYAHNEVRRVNWFSDVASEIFTCFCLTSATQKVVFELLCFFLLRLS